MTPLSNDEILARRPLPAPAGDPVAATCARVAAAGEWTPQQALGRRFATGCVALEITQRCNLDCTLCYLSDHAEAIHDIPLAEVLRRVALIRAHFGPHTEVQVTGGDPTLRDRAELITIVRAIASAGMRSSLFTNGIKATRELLVALAAAGLTDVAFHVDMTQERAGYPGEASLNALRAEYLARARGLPLAVVFNTTVFDGNFEQLPVVARFFRDHAAAINLASFQLQAETGRGALGARGAPITKASVAAKVNEGLGAALTFDNISVGHAECNRYGLAVIADGRVHDMLDDRRVVVAALAAMGRAPFDRARPVRRALDLLGRVLARPRAAALVLPWGVRKLWAMRRDLWASGFRPAKLTVFLHDFMDAAALDPARIDACAFQVMTAEGPMSMCLHNARRDEVLLRPLAVPGEEGFWDPLTGRVAAVAVVPARPSLTIKTARGRRRIEIRHQRRA